MTLKPGSYKNTYNGGRVWTQARSAGRALRQNLAERLRTHRMGHCFLSFQEIDSTNSAAAAWAAEGVAEGAVVTSEIQTRGRGRFGRPWLAAPGQNLTFSVVLRPNLPSEGLGLIVLAAGVAVVRVVARESGPVRPCIKWPNDILLGGRKCCGMLLETSTGGTGSSAGAAILGIGLNVNQDFFPDELASKATSILLEVGRLTSRTDLLAGLLIQLEDTYGAILEGRTAEIRREYLDHMAGLGEHVLVQNAGDSRILQGTVRGITARGALILETAEGVVHLQAGDVTLLPSPS